MSVIGVWVWVKFAGGLVSIGHLSHQSDVAIHNLTPRQAIGNVSAAPKNILDHFIVDESIGRILIQSAISLSICCYLLQSNYFL